MVAICRCREATRPISRFSSRLASSVCRPLSTSLTMVETVGEHERPLEGIIVADFSRVLAGPLATMMLADLGATVIKVERPGVGDDTRHWGPPWTSTSSSYFEGVNRSKSSVALDLNDVD